MDFLTVHGYRLGRGDPEADPVSLDRYDGDADVAIDHDGLTNTTREN
jgi:hypothetical protein